MNKEWLKEVGYLLQENLQLQISFNKKRRLQKHWKIITEILMELFNNKGQDYNTEQKLTKIKDGRQKIQ